jgi:lethal(2) giant larvae protein
LDDGGALVVLCEEELVVIDLISPKWPSYSLPYLSPIHSSALTACNVVEVKKEIVSKITELGKIEKEKLSKRPWPIKGGHDLSKVLNENKSRDESMQNILLTGHEDGSVRIWSLDKNQMKEIAKITSMKYFETDDLDEINEEEEIEDWPPFRRVGIYDPYSDDPRLAISRIDMCSKSGTILIGGTAGQCAVFILSQTAGDHSVPTKIIDLIEKQEEQVKWKGHQQLNVKNERHFEEAGYQAQCIIQCNPPGAVTALILHELWGLAGIGTSHGFTLFDYRCNLGLSCDFKGNHVI